MTRKLISIACWILIGFSWPVAAEVIPAARRIDWNPGIPGGIPDYPVFANVKNPPYNAVGDGIADDTSPIQRAINDCPNGSAVYLPAGSYRTTAQLSINNKPIALRGAGPDKTFIYNAADVHSIMIYRTSSYGTAINMTSGYTKGSTTLIVADGSSFSAGDYVILSQLNIPGLVTATGYGSECTWCGDGHPTRTMTQIVELDAVDGNTLTLARPCYYTFTDALDPEVQRVSMTKGAGVEDLCVEQVNSSGSASYQIVIHFGVHCWIKNVRSNLPRGAHVRIFNSYKCEVRDSFFNDAHSHGGGRGYGIWLFARNSDHLIENNIIYRVRHSMLLSSGGSGNVFGYNYCLDVLTEPSAWMSECGDFHGAHPYMNLFEGNRFCKLSHDNTWGSSSHNTSFRNHIVNESAGVTRARWAVDVQENNYYINLVGNVIGKSGDSGLYDPTTIPTSSTVVSYRLGYLNPSSLTRVDDEVPNTIYRHGNFDYISNETHWDEENGDHDLPASLYLSSKPIFFGAKPWPLFGPDVPGLIADKLPAQERYEAMTSPPSEPPEPPDHVRILLMEGG